MEQQAISSHVRSSGFFALMHSRDYALLWTSQGISLLGDRFHWIAINLWVYALTKSALSVSFAVAAEMVGTLALGLFAGVLVDRWNRKLTMILADIARGTLVAAIPWLISYDIRLVYLDLFLISCATAFFRPAVNATIPHTVRRQELMPANSFLATMDTGTEIAGPVLAGIVVQSLGYSAAMYLDASSYFVSALLLTFLSATSSVRQPFPKSAKRLLEGIGEGFQYIRRDRVQLGLLVLILFAWWASGFSSLQTPLAKGVLRLTDKEFGWFNGIWGVGFVTSSLVLGWYGRRFARGHLIVYGFLGWILATAAAGLSSNAGMLYTSVFWIGFANITLYVSLATVLMEVTPSDKLGRVLATRQVAGVGVRVLAMLVFGALADRIGVRQSIVGMAGLSLAGLAAGLLLFPEIVRLDERRREKEFVVTPGGALGGGAFGQLAHTFLDRTDKSYDTSPQRRLNRAVLLIGGVAGVALLISNYRPALYLAGVAVVAAALNILLRVLVLDRGSMNLRRREIPSGEESIEGRRSPIATGPTPE